jgi:hypothetical protein
VAEETIVWTVLPFGHVREGALKGRLRVSVVVSPRLKPEAASEQVLKAFPDFVDWPLALRDLEFELRVGNARPVPLEPITRASSQTWSRLFSKTTPVAGFEFKDMSKVNLRSYAVRNVVGFLKEHYASLGEGGGDHPALLPWTNADGALKGMLGALGVRTQTIHVKDRAFEVATPGFERFFDGEGKGSVERLIDASVFTRESRHGARAVGIDGTEKGGTLFPIRVLPSDWQAPSSGGPYAPVMSQFKTAAEYAFYQANRFYRREPPTKEELKKRRPDLEDVPERVKPPKFDFHQIIASFADYPLLLRELGIVIDFALPSENPIASQVPGQGSAVGTMALEIRWKKPHDSKTDRFPRTAWQATKEVFVTRARTGDHDLGLLRLSGASDAFLPPEKALSDFDVFAIDPDGAALKTVNFLLTAQNLVAKSLAIGADGEITYTTGDRQPLAALRSGGIGVSRHGRAGEIAMSAAATALKNDAIAASATKAKDIVLYAEDVLRGYRVDVHEGKVWRSLCRRTGEYRVLKDDYRLELAGEAEPSDEGYVKGASTTSPTNGGDDHYLHETLFKWTGYSLVAPRPGRTIRAHDATDSGLQREEVEDVKEHATSGNGLAVTFRAEKRSLPRLRFGSTYRLRARIVDLAGNSLSVDDSALANDIQATEPVSYGRLEPVDPPALVQRAMSSDGESIERMVIRSNYDADPANYVASNDFTKFVKGPATEDFEYQEKNERHVVPPKSSELQCEEHRAFDAAFGAAGGPMEVRHAYEIASREAGTLFDDLPGAVVELVTPKTADDVATTSALPLEAPSDTKPTGDRLAGGQYIVHREASLTTPYLPDPAAGGIALRGVPGLKEGAFGDAPSSANVYRAPNEELVLLVRFGDDWPNTRGLRIVLAERPATLDDKSCTETFTTEGLPKWDEASRELTIFVSKGRIARLRYSSFILSELHPHLFPHAKHAVNPNFMPDFALPSWLSTEGARARMRGMGEVGAHWMMTPFRPLVLVHATQQPVFTPQLNRFHPLPRPPGASFADLDGYVVLHGPSTGKVELVADWQEWVDDPERPRPERVDATGQLSELQLSENHVNAFTLKELVEEQAPMPGKKRSPGNRHEFGDTRFRLVRYRLRATTRFREYLPPALYAEEKLITRIGDVAEGAPVLEGAEGDMGAPVLFNVPGAVPHGTRILSSARPEVPHVVYVVPTFLWQSEKGKDLHSQSSTRYGSGLRVYLERPWFASGDGELLGVVLSSDGGSFTGITEEALPHVTQWGLDPIWDSTNPKERASVADFPSRVASETVKLAELNGEVQVVGHRVQWDDARKLWFCDIELNTGASYMPFVRLALVRYQPNSEPDAKVSRVVLAEFAQLLPRRRVLLTRDGTRANVRVFGATPGYGPMKFPSDSEFLDVSFIPPPGSSGESGRNKIEVVLQTRDPEMDSDLAWSDAGVLASSLAEPGGPSLPFERFGGGEHVRARAPGRTVTNRLGETVHLEAEVPLGPGAASSVIGARIDRAIWEGDATLPDLQGKPARLMVREFERYYSDRTVPEEHGARIFRRRVVEERLVFADVFPLN